MVSAQAIIDHGTKRHCSPVLIEARPEVPRGFCRVSNRQLALSRYFDGSQCILTTVPPKGETAIPIFKQGVFRILLATMRLLYMPAVLSIVLLAIVFVCHNRSFLRCRGVLPAISLWTSDINDEWASSSILRRAATDISDSVVNAESDVGNTA